MPNNIPQNLQAERAVIGACLLSSEALGTVSEMLKPEDFYDFSNKLAYEICMSMYLEGKTIDITTFSAKATQSGKFERMGGQPFLADLVSDTMMIGNAGYYAEIVRDMARRRRVISAGAKISALGAKTDIESGEIFSEAE
ncbi:MAG: replicative DNA helicase, partial [Synergistaceae bacterium]|nr:replicative DNA helicase [Synergistaceae bacterium]